MESNVSSRGTWPGNAAHLWHCPVWPHLLRFIHRETAQLEAQEVALAGSRRNILGLDSIFLSLWLVVTSGSIEQYSGYVCEWMDEYTPCTCFFFKKILICFGCPGPLFLLHFSLVAVSWELLSSCGMWASRCHDLSSCRASALGHTGFISRILGFRAQAQ